MPVSMQDFHLPSFCVIPLIGSIMTAYVTDVNYDKKAIIFFMLLALKP